MESFSVLGFWFKIYVLRLAQPKIKCMDLIWMVVSNFQCYHPGEASQMVAIVDGKCSVFQKGVHHIFSFYMVI